MSHLSAHLVAPRSEDDPATTRSPLRSRYRADLLALLVLAAMTVVAAWPIVGNGTLIGQDSAAYYYPAYIFLGEQLRSLDLPVWNPNWLGGAPFAADPQSGWTYLPAMIFFTLLPIPAAIDAFLLFHLLLAGAATYLLARRVGMGPGGAAVAAFAFEFTGVIYGRLPCCPGYFQVAAWIPAMLLTADLALAASSWRARIVWWGLAALCVTQIMAVWLGQGTIYAGLALGGFIAYRAFTTGGRGDETLLGRARQITLHGAAILVLALGYAAAALLPRIEFQRLSNLADGYAGNLAWAASVGGWDRQKAAEDLLSPSLYDIGGVVAVLAIAGLLIAGRRHAAPYFAAVTLASLALASNTVTRLLGAVPVIGDLHPHYPERVMMIGALGPAMLAGAAVSRATPHRRLATLGGAIIGLALVGYLLRGIDYPQGATFRAALMLLAGLTLVALAMLPRARLLPAALIAGLIVLDLYSAGILFRDNGPYGGFYRVDPASYFGETPVTAFLKERTAETHTRYVGYDPALRRGKEPRYLYYRYHFGDPRAAALHVNNRGTVYGVPDIQGYNPIQWQRYVDYIDAINGRHQEYHGAYVLEPGLDSPLLHLAGARYIVVPEDTPAGRDDLEWLLERFPTVFTGNGARVLENRSALPRAWLVHEARQVAKGAALDLLASGQVDPREVALLEDDPPPVSQPPAGAVESATVIDERVTSLTMRVKAAAAGLLLVNVNHYPTWQATVNGEPARTYTVDHIFTAIPVPAGTHVVELRQVSRALNVGLAVTAGTIGLTVLAVLLAPPGAPGRTTRPGSRGRPASPSRLRGRRPVATARMPWRR